MEYTFRSFSAKLIAEASYMKEVENSIGNMIGRC